MRVCVVLVFAISLFTIVKCFHVDELIMGPVSAAEDTNTVNNFILQRIKRQAFRLGGKRIYPPVGVQSRAPTVIVVPERGTGTIPAYSTGPTSPYSVGSPNRGTTVVVSQVPEYNYNGIGRTYDIMPINPIRI